MKRFWIAASLLLAFLLPLPAGAQIDAGKAESAKKAAAQFAELASGSEKTGKPPRDSDPAVKKLMDAVFDTRDIDAAKSIPSQALQPLGQRIMTGTQVALFYMLAGTGITDLAQAGNVPSIGERVNLNTIEFASELGRYFDFQLKVQGAVVDGVQARLATAKRDEVKRMEAGIAEVRAGTQRAISGIIETLAINGLTEAWRKDRVPGLVAVAPKLAKFLEPEQKKQLSALALECAAVMDDAQVKKGLETFAKGISAP